MVDLSTAHIQAEVDPVHEYSGTEKPAIFMHHFHLLIFVQEIVPLDFRGSRITQPGLADKPCFSLIRCALQPASVQELDRYIDVPVSQEFCTVLT